MTTTILPVKQIEAKIRMFRGQKVMLDADLAELYEVETKALNQAVKRNLDRFPEDFMFQLSTVEAESLRSQIVTLDDSGKSRSNRRGQHSKYLPYAFTEQGVAMLSSVLKSKRAVLVNISIMRAFVQLRAMLLSHEALAKKVREMEKRYDAQFTFVFRAIETIWKPVNEKQQKKAIGFNPKKRD